MSATRPGDVPSRAVDAALALLSADPTPTPAAPQQPEPQAPEPQPERQGPTRGPGGRFAPRDAQPTPQATPETQPTQPAQGQQPTPGQPPPAAPPPEQIDWQAIALERDQRIKRLEGSYGANLGQKDAEIDRLRKAEQAAREEAARVRQETLDTYRASVDAMPEDTAEELVHKARAERALLQLERQGFEEIRTQTEQQRQAAEEQTRQESARVEDTAQRAAHWGVLEGFAYQAGRAFQLDQAEIAEVIDQLKTPEMAAVLRAAPIEDVRAVVQERGKRLEGLLRQKAEARLATNREQAVASGAHERESGGLPPASEPRWRQFTRERVRRPGLDAAANMFLALQEEE